MRGTPVKRGFALVGVAGLALTASLLGTPATARAELPAKPSATTVSQSNRLSGEAAKLMKGSGVQAEAKAVEAYWTPARMKAAKSADRTIKGARAKVDKKAQNTPDGPTVSIAPGKVSKAPKAQVAVKTGVAPQYSQPNLPSNHPTARTNGKVFFNWNGGSYVCSAAVVNSEGKSLVWTAGHCLSGDQKWSTNVAFVPAYSNGAAPYGVWYANNLTTTTNWFYNEEWAYDVGAITMNRGSGPRIADYLGSQGLMWNYSAAYTSAAFGYPQAAPFNGQYLYRADGGTGDQGDGTIYMYSGLTGGSSGGPWLRNYDGNWGYVNGHNDFIYTASPNWMYSPYYGNQVANLYNAVRYNTIIANLTAATPKISGTAKVGKVLTASAGTWGPAPVTLAYQWKANGAAIPGATGSSLTVPGSAKGKKITVTVTGSKYSYNTTSRTSTTTKKVAAGTLVGATPKISGTAKVGKTLTATIGLWTPKPDSLTYQWYRNSKKIKYATGLTYKLVKSDKGKKISIKVTGKKTGYTTLTKASKKTAKVKK